MIVTTFVFQIWHATIAIFFGINQIIITVPSKPLFQCGHTVDGLTIAVFTEKEERFVHGQGQRSTRVTILPTAEIDHSVVIVDALGQLAAFIVTVEKVLVVPLDPAFAETLRMNNKIS